MKELKYTLIADGSSDRTLLKVIKWLLDDRYPKLPNKGEFASFSFLSKPPKKVSEKVECAKKMYPADIYIYHRDAESNEISRVNERVVEVTRELSQNVDSNLVCVVPIKMMETWFLISESAIKRAADNPNYKGSLDLPAISKLEKEKEPKELLHSKLRQASGLKGRNLDKFDCYSRVHYVADYIEDFNVLRQLYAFQEFEKRLTSVVDKLLVD